MCTLQRINCIFRAMKIRSYIISLGLSLLAFSTSLADEKRLGVNFYTGMFDFSDDKKRSSLFGIEHQNENLYRDTIFGRVSPVTGMMFTVDNAAYFYTGIEANYELGPLKVTPSFGEICSLPSFVHSPFKSYRSSEKSLLLVHLATSFVTLKFLIFPSK